MHFQLRRAELGRCRAKGLLLLFPFLLQLQSYVFVGWDVLGNNNRDKEAFSVRFCVYAARN